EHRKPAVDTPGSLAVGRPASSEPLTVKRVLCLARTLQGAVAEAYGPFARQVGLTRHARGIEWHLPAEHADLHPFTGLGHQQFTDTGRLAVADEIHRWLEAPADD